MTADGCMETVPVNVDLLFFGSSCVDFSGLNTAQKDQDDTLKDKFTEAFGKDVMDGKADPDPKPELDPLFVAILKEQMHKTNTMVSQSWATWLGSIGYVLKARPKVVIVENVKNAPWDKFTNFFFNKCGYAAKYITLDSSNYGVPQTRQRGWLLAVDYQIFDENSTKILESWAKTMRQLEHPNRVSIESFLLSPEDPRIIRARGEAQAKGAASNGSQTNWARSKTRHEFMRRAQIIPEGASSLNLVEQVGSYVVYMKPHQRSDRAWLLSEPTRVLDMIDIVFHMGLNKNCDITFKALVIDLSQNADRIPALRCRKHEIGGICCITPDGIPFLTGQLRKISGHEALHLQGLPIDDLLLSSETQQQLRDLAGNAMTATVASAAILSLIIALDPIDPNPFDRVLHEEDDNLSYRDSPKGSGFSFDISAQIIVWSPSSYRPIDASFFRLFLEGRRYCFCRHTVAATPQFRECEDCGETACAVCAGNPIHNFHPYSPIPSLDAFTLKAQEYTKRRLAKYFPGTLTFRLDGSMLSEECLEYLAPIDDNNRIGLLDLLYQSQPIAMYLNGITISEDITVHYQSNELFLRAVISKQDSNTMVTWYVLINPSSKHVKDLGEVPDLEQPIARSVLVNSPGDANSHIIPTGEDTWQVWKPGRLVFKMEAMQEANGNIRLSMESDAFISLPGTIPEVYRKDIEDEFFLDADRLYHKKPNCGTAERALYTADEGHLYLFKDCKPYGPAEADGFVIAHTNRQLESHEYREVKLRFDPEIQFHKHVPEQLEPYTDGHWVALGKRAIRLETDNTSPSEVSQHTQDAQDIWTHSKGHVGASDSFGQDMNPPMSCYRTIIAFPAELLHGAVSVLTAGSQRLDNGWYRVRSGRIPTFAKSIRPFLLKLPRWSFPAHVQGQQEIEFLLNDDDRRSKSPPLVPKVEFVDLGDKYKKGNQFYAYENQDEARQYMTAMKKLDPALGVVFQVDLDKGLAVEIIVDRKLLIQLALQNLSDNTRIDRSSEYVRDRASGSIRINAAYVSPSKTFDRLSSFLAPSYTDGNGVNQQGILVDGYQLPDENTRYNIVNRLKSLISNNINLDLDQQTAFLKMIYRELHAAPFEEKDFSECLSQDLGVLVTATTSFKNDGTIWGSTGGVLAHDVGYGKTVLCLALCDAQWDYDRDGSIRQRKGRDIEEQKYLTKDRKDIPTDNPSLSLIHLKATLILVPSTILEQWASEVQSKLQPNAGKKGGRKPAGPASPRQWNVLCIKSHRDWESVNVAKMKQADIVLVSDSLFNDKYVDQVAKFSGHDRFKKFTARSYESWYQAARRSSREIM